MCENPTCVLEDCTIIYGECHCGCGGKTEISPYTDNTHGYLKGVPRRYILRHGNRSSPIEYIINEETGCWEWQRAKTKKGYGVATVDGKYARAHRYMYELHKGPIPEGLDLDHLCRNRGCVNPDHLEIVSRAENCRRGDSAKLTQQDVDNIRELVKVHTQSFIAKLFKVTPSNISFIINNKHWVNKKGL